MSFDLSKLVTAEQKLEKIRLASIPAQVTMRQARLALLQGGKLAQVDAAIALFDPTIKGAAEIEWQYAKQVDRLSPLTAILSETLGLTTQQIDNLFILAATL